MSKDLNSTLVRRQEELLQLEDANGQLSVDELTRLLCVSDDTIRRDLLTLEKRNCFYARTAALFPTPCWLIEKHRS